MKSLIRLYRHFFSPMIHGFSKALSGNPYMGCKFEPTCSCYFEQSIQKFGWKKGLAKSLFRLLRCHPFSRSGGYDPV